VLSNLASAMATRCNLYVPPCHFSFTLAYADIGREKPFVWIDFHKSFDSVVTKFRNQSALKEPWLYAESSIMFPCTNSVGVFRHGMFLPLLIPVYSVHM
jgi:hypothetical protein